jgi:hypothetical protein
MIQPHRTFWIPPPLNTEKALREKMEKELKEDQIRIQQERRRIQKVSKNKKEFTTGRQLKNTRSAKVNDDIPQLDINDLQYWNHMVEEKLCASCDVICEMMTFCFDKSATDQHIFELLEGDIDG